jgi:hypothetical protein
MRTLDETGRYLCDLQGALFEQSPEHCASGSAVFIRRFMYSQTARRFDKCSIGAESDTIPSLIEDINRQYGMTAYGSIVYSREELRWIGSLYRCWAYCYEVPSRKIFTELSARKLRELYSEYHALEYGEAMEKIMERTGIQTMSQIEKGVMIMRAKMNRPACNPQ